MARKKSDEAPAPHFGYAPSADYQVHYQFGASSPAKLVKLHTLKSLLQRYKDILWEEGSHKNNVSSFVLELHDLLRDQEFSVFSTDMLDHLIASLRARENSNATINRKMAALSKLLRKAYKMGEIHSLPDFKRQKEKSGRIRFLEHDEEQRLFSAIRARSELYYRFCIFLVDTGARFGEGIALRWNDLQDGRATFWITKSGRGRSVPLTRRAIEAIGTNRIGLGPFQAVDKQQFRTAWISAKQECGFADDKELVPHALRHTCASRLVRGGIDMRRVQMWLGHQTLQMTMRYAHLASHDLDVCVQVLERHEA
jgi:integrase